MTVTLDRVSKRYGRRRPWVVHEVDVDLLEATTTLLTGANGSGKTTLLRIVAGLTLPSDGTVRGRPRRVAVVPDRFVAPVRMTGRAYLRHHARIRGLSAGQADQRIDELTERLGIAPGLEFAIQDLSKGNAQKVSLSQAFLAHVDLLVLDEPKTALDARGQAVLDELVEGSVEAGSTVILSDPTPGHRPTATCYRLGGGHLEPVEVGQPESVTRVRIRLRADGTAGDERALSTLVKLASASSSADGLLTIVVDERHCDDALRLALANRWSVLEVLPDPPPLR